MKSIPSAGDSPTRARWPWFALAGALTWAVLLRLPLILNADTHLDSDLAVDGLALLDAVHGHWRWHFPGTPHIGIVLLSLALPQSLLFGVNPSTLVSGGLVAHLALMIVVFLLSWRAFGPFVAAWGLVPLTFASTGTIWLSGRLTGGHLLTAAWHAGAFALLFEYLKRGDTPRALALGLASGLGLYVDRMFLFTLVVVAPIALLKGLRTAANGPRLRPLALLVLTFALGASPAVFGRWLDPYDAYAEQFNPLLDRDVLVGHARMLTLDCVPRLVAGHRLPSLQSEPRPETVGGRAPSGRSESDDILPLGVTVVSLVLFSASILALALPSRQEGPGAAVIRWGVLVSAGLVAAAFIVNRNIYNSDNYRYLVTWLVPWSVGYGLMMQRLARGTAGVVAATALSLALAGLMTADAAAWYGRFGWIDRSGMPVAPPRRDPALAWLRDHPEVTHVFGDYWDVYRLSFLSGGRVRGVPYPFFPNRFRGWSRGLGPGKGTLAVLRPHPQWRDLFAAVWRDEGRAPSERDRLTVKTWP